MPPDGSQVSDDFQVPSGSQASDDFQPDFVVSEDDNFETPATKGLKQAAQWRRGTWMKNTRSRPDRIGPQSQAQAWIASRGSRARPRARARQPGLVLGPVLVLVLGPQSQAQAWIASRGSRARPDRAARARGLVLGPVLV